MDRFAALVSMHYSVCGVLSPVLLVTHLAAHVAGPVHVQLHVRVKLVLLGEGLLAPLLGNTEIIKYSLVIELETKVIRRYGKI